MEEKQQIRINDFIKFRLKSEKHLERVWGKVIGFDDEKNIKVVIDNHPLTDEWELGDEVTIPLDYVLDYMPYEEVTKLTSKDS